jgi:hypothetical protein
MMERLMQRAEDLVMTAQRRQVAKLAAAVKSMLGSSMVQIEDSNVILGGRGLLKRWLTDPGLRFLSGGLK